MLLRRCFMLVGVVVFCGGPGVVWNVAATENGTTADRGSISGTIDDAKSVRSVIAINRSTRKKHPGQFDRATGKFTIAGLPIGNVYDCLIEFAEARLEGVNLTVPPSDYEEEQPLSEEDVKTIEAKVRRMNKFEDVVEIKTVQGNIQHAVILLNKLRTKPFFGSKPGEVIWRAELWHFQRPEETWLKVQNELFVVLYRERISGRDYEKMSLTFDPALGGVKLTTRRPNADLGRVKPPSVKPGVHLRPANTMKPNQTRRRRGK